MLPENVKNLIDEYKVGIEFSDFEEDERYEYEDLIIPIRKLIEKKYSYTLDKIIEADKRLIKGYETLPESSYLKMILKDIYELAQRNVAIHQEVA